MIVLIREFEDFRKNQLLYYASNKYIKIDNYYFLCSSKLKGCEKCSNINTCLECNIAFDLDEDNKCIPTALAMTRYYKDPTTGKYVSCSKIDNCEECSSATDCTRCKSGYELDNKSCQLIVKEEILSDQNTHNSDNVKDKDQEKEKEKEKEKDKDKENDKKTKSLAIGGIVLGTVGTVTSIAAIILFILKNIIFKGSNSNAKSKDGTESVNINNDEENNNIVIQSKRNIHNEPKTDK